MVSISAVYEGGLHCKAVHQPSGTELATDAPRDNQGLGESFSPTDLVATALGTCILTTLGILARTLDVEITGATATVEKSMTASPPRRIEQLPVTIRIPQSFPAEMRQKFERAAHACPVHRSLHPDVQMPIEFVWGE